MSKYTIQRNQYNFRRYSRPWIARVDFDAKTQGDYRFGDFIGNASDGGSLVINATEGDIIAQGQKDTRGGNTNTTWYQVRNGALVELSGKAEAYALATTPAPTTAAPDPYGFADKSLADLVAMLDALQAEIDRR